MTKKNNGDNKLLSGDANLTAQDNKVKISLFKNKKKELKN